MTTDMPEREALLDLAQTYGAVLGEHSGTISFEPFELERFVASLAEQRTRAMRGALRDIADMTYDEWSNGARAKEIAQLALSTPPIAPGKGEADGVLGEILAEVARATRKFPTWPTDPLHAVAVLGEEFGELTKAVLQLTYEPHKSSHADVLIEAIQTAAMALRFAASLGIYEYGRCEQHEQAPLPAAPAQSGGQD